MPTAHLEPKQPSEVSAHGERLDKPAPVAAATADTEAALDNLARLFDLLARILARSRSPISTDPALDRSGTTEVS